MITNDGLCFTCNHVVDGSKEIYVRLQDDDGNNVVYKADIVYKSEEYDFAIIQLEDLNNNHFYELELEYKNLKTGDDVAIYGYPFGSGLNEEVMELEPSLTKGYIASKNKIQGKPCYYLDIRSAPGNSGGPVFHLKTQKVIGYLCGSLGTDRSNMIYIRTLEQFIKDVVKDID